MNTILIIDDDDALRKSFEKILLEDGFLVTGAASGESGIEIIRNEIPDLVILDLRLPGMNGMDTFKKIYEIEPKLPVIIMTAYGTTETAIEAIKIGAFDYILKPFDVPDMLDTISKALAAGRLMKSPIALDAKPDTAKSDAIIGRCHAMQEVYKSIGKAAPTDATLLIRGESGTGKELVARAVYQHSKRSHKPFLVINCVAIPANLLESELFGYEKGSFTGAVHRRIGKIEQANGGTVLLDEIGDMPIDLQAKLLRLLQEKSIERLGGRDTIPIDVRIIAATNRNLETAIEQGTFREDLYYRLKVVTIWLPPLNEREGDIPLLTEYFQSSYSARNDVPNPGIADDAQKLLNRYSWPGNVRELANVIRKTMIFNRGIKVSREDIQKALHEKLNKEKSVPENDQTLQDWVRKMLIQHSEENVFDNCIDYLSSILVSEALVLTEGNRSQAAKLLSLSRPTLHAKIEKYKLAFETSVKKDRN
ncbi:MAG: sigma-54 dependent transcriptional regulator [Desulfobacterales bacterium]|nr:sigma-54 dependent transcriptional regulator [Desulfobacterales bacterium]